jgi:hypothetical protein
LFAAFEQDGATNVVFAFPSGVGASALVHPDGSVDLISNICERWPANLLVRSQEDDAIEYLLPPAMPAQFVEGGDTADGTREYGGFLLLELGEPLPDSLKVQIHMQPANPSIENLPIASSSVSTLPFNVYALAEVPVNHREGKVQIIRHSTGEVHEVHVTYETFNENLGVYVTSVWLTISLDEPSPYPVWPRRSIFSDLPIPPEKVSSTPRAGLRLASRKGDIYMWTEDGVLYSFFLESGLSAEEADRMIRTIVKL